MENKTKEKAGEQNMGNKIKQNTGEQNMDNKTKVKAGEQNMDNKTKVKAGEQNMDNKTKEKAGEQNMDNKTKEKAGEQNMDNKTKEKAGEQNMDNKTKVKAGEQNMDTEKTTSDATTFCKYNSADTCRESLGQTNQKGEELRRCLTNAEVQRETEKILKAFLYDQLKSKGKQVFNSGFEGLAEAGTENSTIQNVNVITDFESYRNVLEDDSIPFADACDEEHQFTEAENPFPEPHSFFIKDDPESSPPHLHIDLSSKVAVDERNQKTVNVLNGQNCEYESGKPPTCGLEPVSLSCVNTSLKKPGADEPLLDQRSRPQLRHSDTPVKPKSKRVRAQNGLRHLFCIKRAHDERTDVQTARKSYGKTKSMKRHNRKAEVIHDEWDMIDIVLPDHKSGVDGEDESSNITALRRTCEQDIEIDKNESIDAVEIDNRHVSLRQSSRSTGLIGRFRKLAVRGFWTRIRGSKSKQLKDEFGTTESTPNEGAATTYVNNESEVSSPISDFENQLTVGSIEIDGLTTSEMPATQTIQDSEIGEHRDDSELEGGGIQPESNSQTLTPLEREICEVMREVAAEKDGRLSGEARSAAFQIVRSLTYNELERVLQHTVGGSSGWRQVVTVFQLTRLALQMVGSGSVRSCQIVAMSSRYISDKFGDWIVGQGGFSGILGAGVFF